MGIDGLSPALQLGFLGMQRATARLDKAAEAVASGAVMEGLLLSREASASLEANAAVAEQGDAQLKTLVDLLT